MTTESVFISYSSKDNKFASDLANILINSGANVWIDSINGQDDDEKQKAIKSAKLFLIVTSNNALNDESLKQEKDFARDNNVESLLVKIKPCDTASKMRWQKLPCVDLTVNKEEGMRALLKKCGAQNIVTKTIAIPKEEQVAPLEIVKNPLETQSTSSNDKESLRKESLLVSDDDINSVRTLVENRLRGAKQQTYIYIAGAVGLIILVLTNGSFQEMFATGKEEVEGALGFIEKFYPGISAALPTVISGGAFKKLKEHKQNRALVDQIKSKRDRMKKAINTFSEPEIIKLEEDLEKLIKF
ncbi:toll/interleukin-1 receptor domain-containing protein [Olleya sp. AH-315-K02]|nr:toll/interleukin-1 receptor domain-containing protein [Olleya sp. AH-315-K02]